MSKQSGQRPLRARRRRSRTLWYWPASMAHLRRDASIPRHLYLVIVATYVLGQMLVLVGGTALAASVGRLQAGNAVLSLLVLLCGAAMMAPPLGLDSRFRRACAVAAGIAVLLFSLPFAWATKSLLTQRPDFAMIPGAVAAMAVLCAIAHFLWASQLGPSRSPDHRV